MGVNLSMYFHEKTSDRIHRMRYLVDILIIPKHINPRNVKFVIEFVQKFQQESFIVDFNVNHSQSSFALGLAYQVSGCQ